MKKKLLAIAFLMFVIIRCDNNAKDNAIVFCDKVKIGVSTEELKEIIEADNNHLPTQDLTDNGSNYIVFNGFMFSRHICFVDFEDGKIVSKHYEHFD